MISKMDGYWEVECNAKLFNLKSIFCVTTNESLLAGQVTKSVGYLSSLSKF
jgi:hypothetical protein